MQKRILISLLAEELDRRRTLKLAGQKRYRESHQEEIREQTRDYYSQNKDRITALQREKYAANPAKHRAKVRKSKYGLTQTGWEDLVARANGCCQICSSKEELCVDHCHDTGKVRGLLCRKCNAAIGLFKEQINFLKLAINYLSNHE